MKKNLYTFGIIGLLAIILTSCWSKAKPVEVTQGLSYSDTVGLAEFQDWKMQHERVNALDAYKKESTALPVAASNARPKKQVAGSSSNGSMSSGTENHAKTMEKKGWSKAAKGVAIGAGSGAVLGAVIHKRNRALGAVIGGVVGGGVGYGIGRTKDKKDGRY